MRRAIKVDNPFKKSPNQQHTIPITTAVHINIQSQKQRSFHHHFTHLYNSCKPRTNEVIKTEILTKGNNFLTSIKVKLMWSTKLRIITLTSRNISNLFSKGEEFKITYDITYVVEYLIYIISC